jgi:hypothetical protein
MAVKHTKVATTADDGTSEVGTNEWNDNHTIDNSTITNDHLAGSIANGKLATDPLARANHTGSQAASTVSDFDTEVANNSAVTANTAKISYSTAASNAVAANTAKTGITTSQASAITANTAKISYSTAASNTVASKAPISNPTFTGDVTTPSSVLKNQGIAGMSGLTVTTPVSNSIGHVVVAPSGTGTRGQITTSNSSDPSTNGELLSIGSDIYTTNEHAIRTQATGSGTVRPLAVYFDTTKVMQITDATGIDINGNNIDNIQNLIHDTSASGTDVDFSEDQLQTISISANTTFTTANRATGKSKTIKITTDGTARTLTFPSGWKFVGTKPTEQAASKIGILTCTCFGTADTDIVAAYAVEA